MTMTRDRISGLIASCENGVARITREDLVSLLALAERALEPQGQALPGLPPLPEPLEIIWPELHSHALGCGVEDRGLRDRYECAEYGWQEGVDRAAECVPEQIYDADQMHAYARAYASQLALPAGPVPDPKHALQFLEQYGKNLEAAGFSSGDALKACQVIFETKVSASSAVAQPGADERETRDSALRQAKWRFENILERGPSAPTEADAKAGIKAIDAALRQPAEEGGKA